MKIMPTVSSPCAVMGKSSVLAAAKPLSAEDLVWFRCHTSHSEKDIGRLFGHTFINRTTIFMIYRLSLTTNIVALKQKLLCYKFVNYQTYIFRQENQKKNYLRFFF